MDISELAGSVQDLAARVARLEGSGRPAHHDASLVHGLLRGLASGGPETAESSSVVYAGAGSRNDGTVAWQIVRSWDDVLGAPVEVSTRVLSALANATRLRIVGELLHGPVSTGDLAERLEQPSSGQLFHHLKELLAAGLVHQPVRGTYAIRRQHVVPLLAVLSAAADLAAPSEEWEEPS